MARLCSTWSFVIQQASLGLVTWQMGRAERGRERKQAKVLLEAKSLEMSHCHVHSVLPPGQSKPGQVQIQGQGKEMLSFHEMTYKVTVPSNLT